MAVARVARHAEHASEMQHDLLAAVQCRVVQRRALRVIGSACRRPRVVVCEVVTAAAAAGVAARGGTAADGSSPRSATLSRCGATRSTAGARTDGVEQRAQHVQRTRLRGAVDGCHACLVAERGVCAQGQQRAHRGHVGHAGRHVERGHAPGARRAHIKLLHAATAVVTVIVKQRQPLAVSAVSCPDERRVPLPLRVLPFFLSLPLLPLLLHRPRGDCHVHAAR